MNAGFIYCLYNPFFKSYGENVYKLGRTNNLNTRLGGYTTGYIDKSEYILTSAKLSDKNLAEKLLFSELEKYRIKDNREFFKCDIKIIKKTFDKVELKYKLNDNDEAEKYELDYNKLVDEMCEVESNDDNNDDNIIFTKYICGICNKIYSSQHTLWVHYKKLHEKEIENILKCKFCDKNFDNKEKKYYHQKNCTTKSNIRQYNKIDATINNIELDV